MAEKLRLFKASDFEGSHFDSLLHFVHDVFHTPIHSAIGNSFVAFVGVSLMMVTVLDYQQYAEYVNTLVK
jgi:hypothetical protein